MLEKIGARRPPSGGSRPVPIGSRSIAVSLQPAIPRRVAPQHSPLPLHRSPTIVVQSRSGEATSLQGCRPAFGCDACRIGRVRRPTGVSFLLCTQGVISILRRQSRNCDRKSKHTILNLPSGNHFYTPCRSASEVHLDGSNEHSP